MTPHGSEISLNVIWIKKFKLLIFIFIFISMIEVTFFFQLHFFFLVQIQIKYLTACFFFPFSLTVFFS